MKLNPVRLANAIGGATAILFPLCALIAYTARDFLVRVFEGMVHSIDVTPLTSAPAPPFDFGKFLLGWIGISVYLWIGGWLGGVIYNAGIKEAH